MICEVQGQWNQWAWATDEASFVAHVGRWPDDTPLDLTHKPGKLIEGILRATKYHAPEALLRSIVECSCLGKPLTCPLCRGTTRRQSPCSECGLEHDCRCPDCDESGKVACSRCNGYLSTYVDCFGSMGDRFSIDRQRLVDVLEELPGGIRDLEAGRLDEHVRPNGRALALSTPDGSWVGSVAEVLARPGLPRTSVALL